MKRNMFLIALFAAACGRGSEGAVDGDCSDGQDNDVDRKYDCDDDGCKASDFCVEKARKIKEEEEALRKAAEERRKAAAASLGPVFKLDNLLVQSQNNGQDIDWYRADEYCRSLSLEGKSGWRLPTQEEALKIVESGKLNDVRSYVMWTSTMKSGKRAVIVGISKGAVNDLALQYDGECRARCVLSADN